MKAILIGSRAMQYYLGGVTPWNSKDRDWDIVCDPKDVAMFDNWEGRIDFHLTNHLNNNQIFQFAGKALEGHPEVSVCSLRGLAAIKRSHLWRDYQWGKHLTHYHQHLKPYLSGLDKDFITVRTEMTKKAYPQGNPSLMQTNEDFFDDAVEKKYDHDTIHDIVAYNERPVWMDMKRDMTLAKCDKDMWLSLPQTKKLQAVAEEAYVIATERFMVPSSWVEPSKLAYYKALRKICTTLTSGWFRDFAIDNFPTVYAMYDQQKFQHIKGKLDEL